MKKLEEFKEIYAYDCTKELIKNIKKLKNEKKYKISINIMVRNEERCISRCLISVYELADGVCQLSCRI